jgi:hypothetical protein
MTSLQAPLPRHRRFPLHRLLPLILTSVLASSPALAIDPSDEDASYLPQSILNTLVEPRYGHDDAAYRKCLAKQRKGAAEPEKEGVERCRRLTTPRMCRELSPYPPEKVSKSAQEICAERCRKPGVNPRPTDCRLN